MLWYSLLKQLRPLSFFLQRKLLPRAAFWSAAIRKKESMVFSSDFVDAYAQDLTLLFIIIVDGIVQAFATNNILIEQYGQNIPFCLDPMLSAGKYFPFKAVSSSIVQIANTRCLLYRIVQMKCGTGLKLASQNFVHRLHTA